MRLVLDEDQQMLADTARSLADRQAPVGRLRSLREAEGGDGFSRELWASMAELGLLGIPFAEDVGGAGLGMAELAVILEALGRNLAPEPLLSTVLLAGRAVDLGGNEALRREWIPRVVSGEAVLAWAHEEPGSRYERADVSTRAERVSGAWALSGRKTQVLDGMAADALVVVARTSGEAPDPSGLTLFLVPADADELSRRRHVRVDARHVAIVDLDGVVVGENAVLGEVDAGIDLVEAVLDWAAVGLCCEMLGAMTAAFEQTVDYLKERVQFGKPIGANQALKHRAARLFIEIELCRSAVLAAARSMEGAREEVAAMASLVKAQCGRTFLHVAEEAIQLHGGIGMTDEHDVGFYLKRARATDVAFGDAVWHRDRWARLRGY